MSGRTKRIIFYIVSAVTLCLAVAGVVLLACFGPTTMPSAAYICGLLICFVFCLMLFPLHTFLHEAGHLLGGICCGMRVFSFSFGVYRLDWRNRFRVDVRFGGDANGATELLPKREKGARAKLVFALYAGAALNFLYAAVMLALFFTVTRHPAMLFFTLFAPLCLHEGLMALYPVELPAGSTDGKFAAGLIRKTPDAEVALRVMTAQGLLYSRTYGELDRALLFDVPVVREDSAAYLALLQLQWRTLFCLGDADAGEPLARLAGLFCYVPEENRGEVAADLLCGSRLFAEICDAEAKYRAELHGATAIELTAAYLLDRTEENGRRARLAISREKAAGERDYLERIAGFSEKEQ